MCLAVQSAFGQLNVTPDNNANDLANTILGSGITLNSTSYSGAAGAVGTFTGGTSTGLGFDTGIILTTGSATGAEGPNNSASFSVANGTPGSTILSGLIGGATTFDAATLTINISVATSGQVFFNYVFGSEEYNEYVGSQYNDVFGFFLDGTAPANNIALIPGTTTPVSINNVNNGVNSAYYRDNSAGGAGGSGGPFNLQYDGLTTVLTVDADLTAGEHTITLAIADTGDELYDSGVFIQAGTLSTNQTPTVPDATSTFALLGAAFSGMAMLRRKK